MPFLENHCLAVKDAVPVRDEGDHDPDRAQEGQRPEPVTDDRVGLVI